MNQCYRRNIPTALALLGLVLAGPAAARSLGNIPVQNDSLPMPTSSPLTERFFETASTPGPVEVDAQTHSVTHRLAFLNTLTARRQLSPGQQAERDLPVDLHGRRP